MTGDRGGTDRRPSTKNPTPEETGPPSRQNFVELPRGGTKCGGYT